MLKKIVILSLSVAFSSMQPVYASQPPSPAVMAKTAAVALSRAIAVMVYTTLCHELGHAVAAKACFGSPIDIHLGSSTPGKEPLASLGCLTVHNLDLYAAHARFTHPHPDSMTAAQRAKLTSVFLAGGLAGILGYWLARAGVVSALRAQQGIAFSPAGLWHRSVVFDGIVANQLFGMLYPYKNYDGAQICDVLGIPVPDAVRNNASLAMLVRYLLQVASAMHVYKNDGINVWEAAVVALPSTALPGLTSTAKV